MSSFKSYLKSFSTHLGWLMGGLYYLSYASPEKCWDDLPLICVSVFVAFFAPYYSKFSNTIDEKVCFRTASVFAGKSARFVAQYLFNVVVFMILLQGNSIKSEDISGIGGIYGISFLISLASQGMQYLALSLSNRDVGARNFNITVSVMLNVLVGAMAAQGLPVAQSILKASGIVFGIIGLLYSLFTDVRALFPPRGGVGLFFGTFNPVHKTHAKMIREFIRQRDLEKVIIHPTLIPKVHRQALEKGQIRIKEIVAGMRVYETTEKADIHVNYFLTGNKFYEVDHRINMLKAMLAEEGLQDIVEVWNLTDLYNNDGFYGVINEVKKKYPGVKLHGLHGSDVGGMLVRAIYDESLSIIPYPVRRADNVSATAIRKGEIGMTTKSVEKYLTNLQFT